LAVSPEILDTPIDYLKGIGPSRGETLRKELHIHSVYDLLHLFPFRYIDRTRFHNINEAHADGDLIQLRGRILTKQKLKSKTNQTRLSVVLKDETGTIELVWFQNHPWFEKTLVIGEAYIVFGKVSIFGGNKTITHPEMELYDVTKVEIKKSFDPVYPSTSKVDAKGMESKTRRNIIAAVLDSLDEESCPETLPHYFLDKLKLVTRLQALRWIHFPSSEEEKEKATLRIKFEEYFVVQVRLLQSKIHRKHKYKSIPFSTIGEAFNKFYAEKLTFELTGAQKRVLKEIRADLSQNSQMNRLLQGDVGSGKTIVALLSMLMAIDNDCQSCLMAPTEILAQQHYTAISEALEGMDVKVAFLSGSVKGKKRQAILEQLEAGETDIIIGTHALIEDHVVFKRLGLAVVDEQHRFGVAQRASLWKKNDDFAPHVLVMTATPIPRTLAMTIYGDLEVSIIDELPPGRKDIVTLHKYEVARPQVIKFMHDQIAIGRQIYIVYPLIEESAKLDLQNLDDGYNRLLDFFAPPDFQISIVHGRLKAAVKANEMKRFIDRETQIMVATTVIEVGVNVPNASVMIIENTERFGLSQLHQLRGRVGRGADQSYCILMSDYKISKEGKERIATMVRTNNGFEIADADLRLRGPGDIQGTQQSGLLDFKLINIVTDKPIMDTARNIAIRVVEDDPALSKDINASLKDNLTRIKKRKQDWGRIS